MTTQTTNEESSIILAKKAALALIQSAGKDWEEAQKQITDTADLLISACNLVRGVGLKLIEASGHEQISFEFFRSHQHILPKSLTFASVKKCIHIARHFEAEVTDMNEVRQVQQSLFEAFGVTEPPHRELPQVAHERNWFSDWVSATASLDSLFRKADKPLEDRSFEELRKIVDTTEAIADINAKAKALLFKK